ncbi:MAG: hypothetical protein ABI578_07485 [Chloroflexota bacterium]
MTGTAILRGVVVPFGILVLAFSVLLFAGMAGSLGPLDLATAQWFILALWVAAPVVGGISSRGLGDRQIALAATVLAVVLGLAVATVLLTGAGTASSCQVAGSRSAAGFVGGCLGVAAIVGIGMGASLLTAARLAQRGRRPLGIILGGGVNILASAGAYFLFYSVVTCLRP